MDGTTRAVRADGAALVLGGPYGNLQATTAVLAEAGRLGIPPSRVVCTGDLVAYCGDPVATIDLVRDSAIRVVKGNCDEQLATRAAGCGCGFPEGSTCERLSAAWFSHADAHVRADQRVWLAELPGRIDIEVGDRRLAVIHGGVASINQFVFASSPALAKLRDITAAGTGIDGVIGGHCGLPFTQVIDGRLWHNAGVVGMPAHDGTPRVWYSLLTPLADGGIGIEHCALSYDHQAAAAAMAAAGLPQEYRAALASGIWPSCDVLPHREIRASGIPLTPGKAVWRPDPAERCWKRGKEVVCRDLWPVDARDSAKPLEDHKFKHPFVTAKGEPRASVALRTLETLWLNTGTLCNITCRNCYIESSPLNDSLVYLSLDDVRPYLDEIERDRLGTSEIGLTGGEPFMNPHALAIIEACLSRGFRVLVLTNAMRPMTRHRKRLAELDAAFPGRLALRVSLDHFSRDRHEEERGLDTFEPTMDGLKWLVANRFDVAVAGRTMWAEPEDSERDGYRRLFAQRGIALDVDDPSRLVLFPEMDAALDVPEITTACWGILGKSPDDMMCSSSRMVVKRKGAERAAVVSCTLLPYDAGFELGPTLRDAARAVPLNHSHCARFCVLGGASCSPASKDATAAPEKSTETV